MRLGTRHSLHKVYSYLNGGTVGSLFQHRFFGTGAGYANNSTFLEESRCGHSYADKKVKRITDVKASGDLDVPDASEKTVSGVLHADTSERLRAKKEIKDYRFDILFYKYR